MLPEAAVSRGDAALERIREPGVTRKLVGIEALASHNECLRLIQAATRRCLELTADSRRVQVGHMRSARVEDSHLVPSPFHCTVARRSTSVRNAAYSASMTWLATCASASGAGNGPLGCPSELPR